jgi:hypothetical protein
MGLDTIPITQINRRYDSSESQIKRAESALKSIENDEMRVWLSDILNALKMGKYARIQAKSKHLIDVSAVAYTYEYASFFDVYNHIEKFDTTIKPVMVEKLEYRLIHNCKMNY